MNTAKFKFYAELNYFLKKEHKNISFTYGFSDNPAIKDSIEALGVPHPEVGQIIINHKIVNFNYQLKNGDQVLVYPSEKIIKRIKFILDTHLGKLAKFLRMLGFDTLYQNNYTDKEIITLASEQKRIILTRDIGLLKNSKVTLGYFVRHITIIAQVKEIIIRFNLSKKIKPFTRCLECNGKIAPIAKAKIINKLPADTKRYYKKFYQCSNCGKIYWQGSHYKNMLNSIKQIRF
jgi:uncharacterized protein with PIN domain